MTNPALSQINSNLIVVSRSGSLLTRYITVSRPPWSSAGVDPSQ
jgi:hypothetical protein